MEKSYWNKENIPDQTGKVIIVTGTTSGLGKEIARVLASKHASVIMAIRNIIKGERVLNEIKDEFPGSNLLIQELDLASLESIRNFSENILKEFTHIDVLINNAGIMMCPYSKTKDGFEIQMGTNHLGHFALTGYLMPLLKSTIGSCVVATSSMIHRMGNIDFSDFNWEKRKYNSIQAYSDSKLANLYFTYELTRKFKGNPDNPKVTAAHPGWTGTDLQRHSGVMKFMNTIFSQGTDTGVLPTLRAAFDPHAESGDYFGPSQFFGMHGPPVTVKSNKRSYDEQAARKLWEISVKLTAVKY